MSDKTFKQLLDDGEVSKEELPTWTARWYDLKFTGEDVPELYEWLGFDSAHDYSVTFDYNTHFPAKVAEGIPEDLEEAGRYLWSVANHFVKRDAAYVRNGDVLGSQPIYRIVYGNSDWEIVKSYLGGIKYGMKFVPNSVKGLVKLARNRSVETNDLDWMEKLWYEKYGTKGMIKDYLQRPYIMGRAHVQNETHSPDGYFQGDGTIFHWEEDGEYYQLMQQSVGTIIAEFILAEPDNPYAQMLGKEISRLIGAYDNRVKQIKKDNEEYRKEHPYFQHKKDELKYNFKKDVLPELQDAAIVAPTVAKTYTKSTLDKISNKFKKN